MKTEPKPIIVKKSCKHVFTPEEIAALNVDFGTAYDAVKSAEADFDAVKSVHKAKITEAESRMVTLRATINAGFEMRVKELTCVFRPKDKKKDFYPMLDGEPNYAAGHVLIEDMTQDDFQQELIQAESVFSKKKEIELWNAGEDKGLLIVGQLGDKWYSALRGNVGKQVIEERLDSEQKAFKERKVAIAIAAKRCDEWLALTLGKDAAKGFRSGIETAVQGESDKVE